MGGRSSSCSVRRSHRLMNCALNRFDVAHRKYTYLEDEVFS